METTETNHTIEDIITAFQGYALSDIKFNADRPIAAGILCACLFDQMSAFFYKGGKAVDRARKFIDKYLPQYKTIDLYEILRNPLVHNYSIKRHFALTSDPLLNPYGLSMLSSGIIYIPSFINDVELAVGRAVKDLREDKTIQAWALVWEKEHKVLVQSKSEVYIYSEEEITRLQKEYLPLIQNHKVFVNDRSIEVAIMNNSLPFNNYEAYVEIRELEGDKKTSRYPLHFFVEFLGIQSPLQYLESPMADPAN